MNVLVIVNDQPYGSERPYNALRLATTLSRRDGVELRVFLFGDAVMCAIAGQQLPEGHYHLDRMLKPLVRRGEVACCGTCMDARGRAAALLVTAIWSSPGAPESSWMLSPLIDMCSSGPALTRGSEPVSPGPPVTRVWPESQSG
jgi:uncharacterized protein involved in oxidation of intracellular sulfur